MAYDKSSKGFKHPMRKCLAEIAAVTSLEITEVQNTNEEVNDKIAVSIASQERAWADDPYAKLSVKTAEELEKEEIEESLKDWPWLSQGLLSRLVTTVCFCPFCCIQVSSLITVGAPFAQYSTRDSTF